MLIARLLHFPEKIPDVKLNIKRREKQLFKPIIRIFQNAKTLDELLPVISKYVTQRREANFSTLHAFLYRAVRDMIKSRKTSQLESGSYGSISNLTYLVQTHQVKRYHMILQSLG